MSISSTTNSTTNIKKDVLNDSIQIEYSESLLPFKEVWNDIAEDNIFMRSDFLNALEDAPPSGTSYRYVILKQNNQPVAIVYFQVKIINLYLSLRLDANKPTGFLPTIWHSMKSFLAKRLKASVLVCGNMTLTGSNGFIFNKNFISENRNEIISLTIEKVAMYLQKEKEGIRAILVKDYYSTDSFDLEKYKYTKFQVQPNMILSFNPEWSNYSDYTSAMKKKYRTRERRARKKAAHIRKQIFSLENLNFYQERIIELYKNVAEHAGFNLFILPENYFFSLKNKLGDKMKITGYFEGDRLVGFYTGIENHNDLDAHFLGYEPSRNRDCQLYLNMLYDLVEDSFEMGAKNLIMSRTALEIKSSVGAKPHNMDLYLKVLNPILNLAARRGLNFFSPKLEWLPRNPF